MNMNNPWNDIYTYEEGKIFNDPNRKVQGAKHGTPVGSVGSHGYLAAGYQRKSYLVHRIIYEMHYGPIPDGMFVDHIDGNPANNRIENLRLATNMQNQQNRKVWSNKKGCLSKGIYLRENGKYRCQITVDGKLICLGTFSDLALAEQTIQEAREQYHGDFARH